jgi:hypothetical protein
MRLMLLIGALVAIVVIAVATSGVTQVVSNSTNPAVTGNFQLMGCNAAIGPWDAGGGAKGQADAARLNDEQRNIVARIISIGQERKLPPLAWQVAIQAGMTESGLRPLNYGDRDSLGIFQMRPSMGWGTPAQVTDPTYAINKFYDVLLKVPDWENKRPGDSAQAVERSAFPDRYHNWESMAAFLLGELGQITDRRAAVRARASSCWARTRRPSRSSSPRSSWASRTCGAATARTRGTAPASWSRRSRRPA